VHAAGIELDDAFLVGKATESHAVVIGIVLGALDHADRRIERVTTGLQEAVGGVEVFESVARGNDDGPRPCGRGAARGLLCLGGRGNCRACKGQRSGHRGRDEVAP
jgi:hypothetical protein